MTRGGDLEGSRKCTSGSSPLLSTMGKQTGGASAMQGPPPGDKVNGARTVSQGRIVARNIASLARAEAMAKSLYEDMGHHFNYEVTGVEGNYKVIERDLEPGASNYIA